MAERLIDIIKEGYNKDGVFSCIYLDGEKGHACFGAGRIVFDAYQSKIWIDADALPQGRDNAYAKEVYMDGETMKIRRE